MTKINNKLRISARHKTNANDQNLVVSDKVEKSSDIEFAYATRVWPSGWAKYFF